MAKSRHRQALNRPREIPRKPKNPTAWFAAVFHLKRLAALRPDDPAVKERLANAEANLAEPADSP